MNILFFIFLLLMQLKIYSMHEDELIKIIANDEVELLSKAIDNGLDVNTTVDSDLPMLIYALSESSNKISQLLIRKGADVNKMVVNENNHMISSLFLALNEKTSLETLKLLLDNGANINSFYIRRTGFSKFNTKYSKKTLFDAMQYTDISEEKRLFIANYLINLYGKDVLSVCISNCESLFVVKYLIENGASIPPNIIDIANKLTVSKWIITFLQRQFEMNKVITENVNSLPYEIADLINIYARGPEQTVENALIEAITSKDFHFIKNYIQMGGDPNFIIQTNGHTLPLLLFAIYQGAEDIAFFLIENNADINMQGSDKKTNYSALLLAFELEKISLNLIEKLLQSGADISNIGSEKAFFKHKKWNIASFILSKNVTEKKTDFLLDYLHEQFGENLFDFILESEISLVVIRIFISELNLHVTKHHIAKAEELGHPLEIIYYLKDYVEVDAKLTKCNINLPSYTKILITDYIFDKKTHQGIAAHKCITC